MPSLSSFCAVEKPGKPRSTMNAVMPRAPAAAVGLGVDDEGFRQRPVGDPHLAAIEHVAIAALVGAGAHRHHVGAGTDFRHRQRADVFAGDQLGEIAPFWLSVPLRRIWLTHRFECAPYESPTEPEARDTSSMATQWARYPSPAPPNSSSTVMPSSPRLPISGHRSRGKVLPRSIVVGARRDPVLGKAVHAIAQCVEVVAEPEIKAAPGVGNHRVPLGSVEFGFIVPTSACQPLAGSSREPAGRAPAPSPAPTSFYQASAMS